ncbi:MAG TPA: ABC transporter substrate-binding protein [Bdellovibrionales bacterium]|nr:ABC transporter substrate-binding protein [Bdellovibrionales bacterium]
MVRILGAALASLFILSACTKKSADTANTFQYALRQNLPSMDPAMASNLYANEVLPNIYEGLLEYNYLKRPYTLQPNLAAAMPESSKDGLVHTFKIKPGVKFQDNDAFPDKKGREVTAEDFIYSWKRLADPATKSEGWWIFDGKIKGLNEWRDKVGKDASVTYDTPVEGLQAVDKHTLKITLSKPFFQLYYVLAMTYASVVPKEVVDKYGQEFMNHPVGTGPYMFESWVRGNKVVLVRNPNWRGGTYPSEGMPEDQANGLLADAGKPIPFIDKIIFHEVPEDQPRWLNLMKGNYDYGQIPKDSFDAAVVEGKLRPELEQKGYGLIVTDQLDVVYQGFNMEDPILGKNVELRRALSYAYDQKTANQKFYNNRVTDAQSVIVPGMDGYDPNFKNPYKEYNLEKAKAALKKAGYPDGKGLPPIEYNFSSSTTGRQMAEFAAQQYAQIGVKLNLIGNSWPQFQDRLRNKKAQMFGIAWSSDYPDPENNFQLLYGPNVSPGPNSANYANKEFDALYEAAAKLPPGAKRTELYKKMRDIFVRDMPWIPTVHRQQFTVRNGWLMNLKPDDTVSGWFKYLRIDETKKKELKAKL